MIVLLTQDSFNVLVGNSGRSDSSGICCRWKRHVALDLIQLIGLTRVDVLLPIDNNEMTDRVHCQPFCCLVAMWPFL